MKIVLSIIVVVILSCAWMDWDLIGPWLARRFESRRSKLARALIGDQR